ncbi:gliding motility lipoprotein GldH [Nonlabens xiamenensis]|uniref:gliding motility lipoprotein GldH n=1 Tax=Nonlabens xiamenensis TaxID=2341043 RepID=UPI000F60C665|nr:gliding motility lipoprotein GldH [Nonlabens xiamenensis]
MKRLILLFFVVLICVSCDDQLVASGYATMPEQGWPLDEEKVFEIISPDTTQVYDLYVHLRNTHDYPYNNLWIISQMKFPQGKTVTDTLQYQMTNPQGEFLGSGSGDVFENKLWLKEGVRFRESGTYQLSLRHAMRKNGSVNGDAFLNGILDVGYSIEKQSQNGKD